MAGGVEMRVHFIDTSVFTNILDIPFMNDQRKEVIKELNKLIDNREIEKLILPFATIIETGNHIAHNGDGNQRRQAAERFCKVIRKTLEWEAPWAYYGKQLQEEDLQTICGLFPDAAMRGEGFGDLSIINAYNKYKNETPAISEIRIWSIDSHMQDRYNEKFELPYIRNN